MAVLKGADKRVVDLLESILEMLENIEGNTAQMRRDAAEANILLKRISKSLD